jgi:hypothetical protein
MDMQTLAAAVALSKGSGGGGGSFNPDITDPQDGDTLVYNAAQQKWVNGAGGGGGVMILHEDENGVLDKTWAEIKTALSTTVVAVYSEYEDDGVDIFQTDMVNNVNQYMSNYEVACSINSYMASAEDEYPTKG